MWKRSSLRGVIDINNDDDYYDDDDYEGPTSFPSFFSSLLFFLPLRVHEDGDPFVFVAVRESAPFLSALMSLSSAVGFFGEGLTHNTHTHMRVY